MFDLDKMEVMMSNLETNIMRCSQVIISRRIFDLLEISAKI